MNIVQELRQFGESHLRNGERRTADLLFRAADHIIDIEAKAKIAGKRIERLIALREPTA